MTKPTLDEMIIYVDGHTSEPTEIPLDVCNSLLTLLRAIRDGRVKVVKTIAEPTVSMLAAGNEAGLSFAALLDDAPFSCERATITAAILAAPVGLDHLELGEG